MSKWFTTDKPLEDGYYFRRIPNKLNYIIVIVEDKKWVMLAYLMSERDVWNGDFSGYEWQGPIKPED